MSLQVINKKLDIYSCSIADLTLKQAQEILSYMGKKVRLCDITVFFDSENGRVYLNNDHSDFEQNKTLTEKYLSSNELERFKMMDYALEIESDSMCWIMYILRLAIECREIKFSEINIKRIDGLYFNVIQGILEKSCDDLTKIQMAFCYGLASGRREERSRKKKQFDKFLKDISTDTFVLEK